MDIIDALNISNASKTIYKNALRRHLKKTDLEDFNAVTEILATKTKPVKLVLLSALFHITKDKRYSDLKADEDQRYKSILMEKRSRNPIDIKWEKKVEEMRQRHENSPDDQEYHALLVWIMLMKNHPRRFKDYHFLSVEDNVSFNCYDKVGGTVTFNVFKTSKSSIGERVVVLQDEVKRELDKYIEKFSITGMVFPVKEQRIRYLMKRYGIPLCNINRKFQESEDIKQGKSHYETAMKYNHTIQAQMVYYVSVGEDCPPK